MAADYVNPDVMRMFPWKPRNGDRIVGEMCQCKHERVHHYGPAPVAGHGPCSVGRCRCAKFRWAKSIKEGER